MLMDVKIIKKGKANLAICLRYGYVCKVRIARKFKLYERVQNGKFR
ncbi:Uncharacterised protein [Campylobacter hyointestinalis]|uniref:Uncharacterized protein n=1 Tax=Campylobacter hyointestinalis subsp. hyointestinalis TaxID=91352 RepID=A0A0S4SRC3_CAMHY|nr:Uncharacterised protein [Campylobacter hyointestinalis subsp. hyointestinalis]CUU88955.1 Uncharacterised protein [Campylobacter hyointestinalis]